MATNYSDVLRVWTGESGLPGTLRNKQLGFETDGANRMAAKDGSGNIYYWTPDGETGIDSSRVSYNNGGYPALTNIELATTYLLNYLDKVDAQIISFNDNQISVEKGDTISSVSLTWGITGSIDTVTLTDPVNGSTGLGVGYSGALNINYSPDLGSTGIYTYTLSIRDVAGHTDTATDGFAFGLYKYWGQSANDYSSIDETIIEAASNGGSALSVDQSSSRAKSEFSLAGGGNYVYYAYPAAWGTLSSIKVNGFGSTWNYGTVSVTNAQGNTENYYAYVSPNVINGTVTLAFS